MQYYPLSLWRVSQSCNSYRLIDGQGEIFNPHLALPSSPKIGRGVMIRFANRPYCKKITLQYEQKCS